MAGIRRTLAELSETESYTVMVAGSISGPVMATGERERPLRRQASAAAVAIGPGMPFTMTRMAEKSNESVDIWRAVVDLANEGLKHCEVRWTTNPLVVCNMAMEPRKVKEEEIMLIIVIKAFIVLFRFM